MSVSEWIPWRILEYSLSSGGDHGVLQNRKCCDNLGRSGTESSRSVKWLQCDHSLSHNMLMLVLVSTMNRMLVRETVKIHKEKWVWECC